MVNARQQPPGSSQATAEAPGRPEDLALLEHPATADPTGRTPRFVHPPRRPWKTDPLRVPAPAAVRRIQERLRRPLSRPPTPAAVANGDADRA